MTDQLSLRLEPDPPTLPNLPATLRPFTDLRSFWNEGLDRG